MTQTIPWSTGGNITLTYTGQGNGTIVVTSDDNPTDVARSKTITVETSNNAISRQVTISQSAGPNFKLQTGDRMKLANGEYFNVKVQTD